MGATGLDTQPSATAYDLEDLVTDAWQGGIRVPHFQRDFRWTAPDVIKLFDSIVRGYPIGSLLLWLRQSPKQSITLGALEIDAPAADNARWVVDGQQRITSLANALHPDGNKHPPFNIYYDMADQKFVQYSPRSELSSIPLPVLFDLARLLEWFNDAGQAAAEYFPEASRVAKRLRQFKVPAYLVRQDDEGVLTDIFDRMNNYGKRLTRAEIFSALFAGPETTVVERSLSQVAQQVAARTGFGTIDEDTVLAAILARRGPDPSREIRNEFDDERRRSGSEFPGEGRDAAYREGERALTRAVQFLQEVVGVPHLALLPYRALLVVLTRFFAHFPQPGERNEQLLRRIYWRVALSGPALFKGTFNQVGRVLCYRIRPGKEQASVEDLLAALEEARPSLPSPDRFRTNEAGGKIILSSWWELRPRSPFTGEPYDSQELSILLADQTTAASVVSRFFRSGLPKHQALWPANRVFVPSSSDPVDEIVHRLARKASNLDEEVWHAVLRSHCMDGAAVAYLAAGRRDLFLSARQELIANQLKSFLARMAEWGYEDTPALDSLTLDYQDELEDPSNGAA